MGTYTSKLRILSVFASIVVIAMTMIACTSDPEPTATSEPTSTPVPAGPTPIAALDVPDDLVPFEELEVKPVPSYLNPDAITAFGQNPCCGYLDSRTSPERVTEYRMEEWNRLMSGNRMLLLVYAPEVDPFSEESQSLFTAGDEGVISVAHSDEYGGQAPLLVSATDERLLVVEEFAYCGDGRGVYLQHSAKPIEIGETFGWESYEGADDPDGDFHMVMFADEDSPITHDGPDPKRIDIKWTPRQNAIMVDAGVIIVGVFAEGGEAVQNMCS